MTDGSTSASHAVGEAVAKRIVEFVRFLRAAGFKSGPGKAIDAVGALQLTGVTDRRDVYWTLRAILVDSRDTQSLFDQAFALFWRPPAELDFELALPKTPDERRLVGNHRLADAYRPSKRPIVTDKPSDRRADAALTYSRREALRRRDFDSMTLDEIREAEKIVARLKLPLPGTVGRRFRTDQTGPRLDFRSTFRASVRGSVILPHWRRRRRVRRPLIALCDISGSMGRYVRMFLRFLHALTHHRGNVSCFLFGTRLTNVTRCLRHGDPDVALAHLADAVEDWDGGTRIGVCLRAFNRQWGRRVLAQGGLVLLISDGLDRDAGAGLAAETEFLRRSTRRLIWLNPLLRYDAFEPLAAGVRAILPCVDDFRPVHNLKSLDDLSAVLGEIGRDCERGRNWLAA